MISLLVGGLSRFFSNNDKLSLQNQELGEVLDCYITEITEKDAYALPSYTIDKDESISDTIYTLPKIINVRVFVLSDSILFFEKSLININNSDDFFSITSLYGKTYENLKILDFSADTNSNVLGGRHYNITMQNIITIEALATSAKSFKKAGYTNNVSVGTKQAQPQKKSALLKGVELVG